MSDLFYRSFEERNRGSRALILSRLKAYLPFLAPFKDDAAGFTGIDLGCGRGEWLEMLRAEGFHAVGVDMDEGMLRGCRENGLEARLGEALQALRELPDKSMNLVSAFHLVEHIAFDDVRALIREALRVLKPAGLLIMETPNPENVAVGTSRFYFDPTHVRPVPPELLSFAVEFEGFKRQIVARLQEDPNLHGTGDIGLWTVLEGVSPDYAVIGQKAGDERVLRAFNTAFGTRYGVMLPALATRYDMQERRRGEEILVRANALSDQKTGALRERLAQAEARIAHLERRIDFLAGELSQIFQSPAWIITAPLRWFATQVRLLRKLGWRTRLSMARAKLAGVRPSETVTVVDNRAEESDAVSASPDMSERATRVYQDLQSAAKRRKDAL